MILTFSGKIKDSIAVSWVIFVSLSVFHKIIRSVTVWTILLCFFCLTVSSIIVDLFPYFFIGRFFFLASAVIGWNTLRSYTKTITNSKVEPSLKFWFSKFDCERLSASLSESLIEVQNPLSGFWTASCIARSSLLRSLIAIRAKKWDQFV